MTFRERLTALNDAVKDYYAGDDLLIEKEKELELISETIDNIRGEQVKRMEKVWDAENELHALMPEDYRPKASETATSQWGWKNED